MRISFSVASFYIGVFFIDGMYVCTEEVVFEMMLIKNLSAMMDTMKKCAATNKGKRIFYVTLLDCGFL